MAGSEGGRATESAHWSFGHGLSARANSRDRPLQLVLAGGLAREGAAASWLYKVRVAWPSSARNTGRFCSTSEQEVPEVPERNSQAREEESSRLEMSARFAPAINRAADQREAHISSQSRSNSTSEQPKRRPTPASSAAGNMESSSQALAVATSGRLERRQRQVAAALAADELGRRALRQACLSRQAGSLKCKHLLAARSVPILFILVGFLVIANTRCDHVGGTNGK